VVALAVRLSGGGSATTAFRLLVVGIAALLVSDTLLAVYVLTSANVLFDPADLIYMLGFACLGASGLHPSRAARACGCGRRGADRAAGGRRRRRGLRPGPPTRP
jgi:hypothetical protein